MTTRFTRSLSWGVCVLFCLEIACTAPSARRSAAVSLRCERATSGDEAACIQRDAAACARVGLSFQYGIAGFAADEGRAREYFRRACDLGEAARCLALAHDVVVVSHDADVERLLSMACNGRIAQGCFELGKLRLLHDTASASQLFAKLCAGGFSSACPADLSLQLALDCRHRGKSACAQRDACLAARICAPFDLDSWLASHVH